MAAKRQSLARFIHVMTPLANIYQLSITNLQIFYDQKGGVIAFNRNGSIFLNLRYYEEWRKCFLWLVTSFIDAILQMTRMWNMKNFSLLLYRGKFLSNFVWQFLTDIRYFTIAHEIAHNLVQPHNSEHEFYFSAICERFIVQLAHLLSNSA